MKDQIGEWGGGEELTRSETWGRCSHNYTHASQRYLQTGYNRCRCSWRQNFRRQRMLPSSDEVHNVGISWNYILLSATYNFGLGKGAKIERNDSKPLCVKTLLVDWGVYVQWAQWVSKTIRQNRMGFSYILSWSCQVWPLIPPFFLNVSTSSV